MRLQYKSLEVHVTEPYGEGHLMSAAEARALCMYRGERIRKALAKWAEAHQGAAPPELRAKAAQLDEEFSWIEPSAAVPSPSAIDQEVARIATERGLHPDSIGVMDEARIRVEARQALSRSALEDLLK